MSMTDLQAAIECVRQHPGRGNFEGEKADDLIRKAESALGLTFPTTYREFLRELGCGNVGGAEFYGVIDADFVNSSVPDAIWLTLDERVSSELPRELIVVAETGVGSYYAIDTRQREATGESPIVEWIPGRSKPTDKLEILWKDYGSFFLNQIQSCLTNPS
jgi:hypothetical protein